MLYGGGRGDRTEARTEREIVEAAARGVEVVRQHRVHLARLYRVLHTLPNPMARDVSASYNSYNSYTFSIKNAHLQVQAKPKANP
jgi:hypothetical protein